MRYWLSEFRSVEGSCGCPDTGVSRAGFRASGFQSLRLKVLASLRPNGCCDENPVNEPFVLSPQSPF